MGTNIANEQAYTYCYMSIICVDKLLEDLFSWLTKLSSGIHIMGSQGSDIMTSGLRE